MTDTRPQEGEVERIEGILERSRHMGIDERRVIRALNLPLGVLRALVAKRFEDDSD